MASKMSNYRKARLKIRAQEIAIENNISVEDALVILQKKEDKLTLLKKTYKSNEKRLNRKKSAITKSGSVMLGLRGVTSAKIWNKTK